MVSNELTLQKATHNFFLLHHLHSNCNNVKFVFKFIFANSLWKLNAIHNNHEKWNAQQGDQFFVGIKFRENWFLLKSIVYCQFAKFGIFNSGKNFKFLNRTNQVSLVLIRSFLISYKRLLQQVKYLFLRNPVNLILAIYAKEVFSQKIILAKKKRK